MKKIFHFYRVWNAKFHLKYICPHCPHSKRETRDLKHIGECYWFENWQKLNYDSVPSWMGFKNFIRLHLFKKPIRICLNGKIYTGEKP